jgi:hypothetical protein
MSEQGNEKKPRSTLGLHLASRLLARLHHHRLCLFRFTRRYELVPTNVVFDPLFGLVVRCLWYLVVDLRASSQRSYHKGGGRHVRQRPLRDQAQVHPTISLAPCPDPSLYKTQWGVLSHCIYHGSCHLSEREWVTTQSSLFRKRRLGRRRDLLQHNVVLVLVDAEFDDRIPVFAGDIVLVHALNDVIDGRLRWGEFNDARKRANRTKPTDPSSMSGFTI